MTRLAPALAGLLGLLALFVGAAFGLDRYGLRGPTGEWDAIVVAGCRVRPDGTASLALQRRTREAVAQWKAGRAPIVVFTGGVGTFPPSEASAAAAYAATLGLPPDAIALEERSTSTEENAVFAAEQLRAAGRTDVLVVTDSYHVFRVQRVFGRHFDRVGVVGSVPALSVRVRGSLREVGAVLIYALTGKL